MQSTVNDIELIDIPVIKSPDGNIAVVEKAVLPYKIERVYYLHDVPSTATRGGHAHKELRQCLIAISGSFDVVLSDGTNKSVITLNKPNKGLLLPVGIWRELENFSSGAVCLVLASHEYDEADYIRSYEDFVTYKEV